MDYCVFQTTKGLGMSLPMSITLDDGNRFQFSRSGCSGLTWRTHSGIR